MKKIIASAGVVAVGVASLQSAPQIGSDPREKPWSISASFRGFYDDNITTLPDVYQGVIPKQDSFGIAVSPSVNFNAGHEQTEIVLGYTFGLKWYEDREPDSSDKSHTVSARIAHSVDPTLSFELADTFRIAQEPEITVGTVRRVPIRGDQDYRHNQASIYVTKALSDVHSLYAGYANTLFKYDDRNFSAHLDRMEHTPLVHLKAQLSDDTVGLIGYRFKAVDYTADDPLPGDFPPDIRDSDSHYVYGGLDHTFTPTVQGSVRLGAQFTKFVNAPAGLDDSAVSPFADANLSYGYAEGSNFQIGIKHERNRHDLAYYADDSPLILDQEQTVVYAAANHQLTPRLNASLVGHYMNGKYEGGGLNIDGDNDRYWAFGISLDYAVSQYLAAEAGYNFDDYKSGVLPEFRSYDRNRVYIGLRASY